MKYDVIVAGGGTAGCAAAYFLGKNNTFFSEIDFEKTNTMGISSSSYSDKFAGKNHYIALIFLFDGFLPVICRYCLGEISHNSHSKLQHLSFSSQPYPS